MRTRRRRRRAVAAVEFAFVLPVLATMMLGMLEMGRAILVKETLSNAAQQAARTGSHPGTASSQVTAEVDTVMTAAGFTGYTVTILVNDVSADVLTAKQYDKVSVKVAIPTAQVFWVSTIFLSSTTIESETVVMMRQG